MDKQSDFLPGLLASLGEEGRAFESHLPLS